MISTRTRAIASLAGVFLLGIIAGAGALGLYLRGQMRDAQSMNDPAAFRGFIEQRLRLTEAQRDSLRDELGETYEDLASLRGAAAEEYRELIDTFSTRVAPQLDPDQRQLLGRLEARMRRRFVRGAVRDSRKKGILDSIEVGPLPADRQSGAIGTNVDSLPAQISKVGPRQGMERKNIVEQPGIPPRKSIVPPDDSSTSMSSALDAGRGAGRVPLPDIDSLQQHLQLSPEQLLSIRQVVSETRQKVHVDQKKLHGFRRLQKEALRRNLLYMDARIESVLDPDQRMKYRALRNEAFGRLRKGRRGSGRRK